MVRVDHEDGGVLNPDDDNPGDDNPGDTPEETAGENATGTPQEAGGDSPEAGAEAAAVDSGAKPPAASPVVRKTSPLGRKPKKRKPAAAPDGSGTDEPGTDDAGTADASADEAATDKAATDKAAADEAVTEDAAADTVSYRDRRIGAQSRRSAREAAAQTRRSTVDASTALRVTALVTGALVLVAGVVLSILFAVGYQRIDHQRELRAEYAGFARQVVVQMTTLDSENADAMYKLAMEKTSGRAQQVFRDNMKQVTEMIREGDAVTKTTVLTEAVSEATDDEGTVLMVVGWESRTKDGSQEPLFQTFRYQVGMTRINGELKVTDLEFVW